MVVDAVTAGEAMGLLLAESATPLRRVDRFVRGVYRNGSAASALSTRDVDEELDLLGLPSDPTRLLHGRTAQIPLPGGDVDR